LEYIIMPNRLIAPNGTAVVTLAATESIAIYGLTEGTVFEQVGFPNYPVQLDLENQSTGYVVLGPYASGATLEINAGPAGAQYSTGVAPLVFGTPYQGAPGALNATGALTAALMTAGIVTSTATSNPTVATLPTGTVMDAALTNMGVGDSFDWSAINTGSNSFDVTSPGASHTVVGEDSVAGGNSGRFRTRKTAAATYITYRLAS
jgi:hypothetical protein